MADPHTASAFQRIDGTGPEVAGGIGDGQGRQHQRQRGIGILQQGQLLTRVQPEGHQCVDAGHGQRGQWQTVVEIVQQQIIQPGADRRCAEQQCGIQIITEARCPSQAIKQAEDGIVEEVQGDKHAGGQLVGRAVPVGHPHPQ
ncbi:hypothetical protein QCD60_28530 [Pokkaliibacter sp. MBI-7]|uniref:hypothetical protein n=1 Tax=Pokkaliibacter sp. MBI-7 TaxID=3040600 RepID=UPI00244C77C4|nr:hypothetical protein [Pokkaliibacter sp. MBI-7]MDH2436464.1 hypothetical protein [Pokkaliibacter sp. MBI-7]